MNLSDLVMDAEYSKLDIMEMFKFSDFGGINYSKETNALIIIFDHNKLYDDSWEGDVLHYTGTGRFGNQELVGTPNQILYESDTNGVNLHLFESFKEGLYTYQGEIELAGDPYKNMQPDANGVNREVWMFPLTKK